MGVLNDCFIPPVVDLAGSKDNNQNENIKDSLQQTINWPLDAK